MRSRCEASTTISCASFESVIVTVRCECGFLYDPMAAANKWASASRSLSSCVESVKGPLLGSKALRINGTPISLAPYPPALRTASSTERNAAKTASDRSPRIRSNQTLSAIEGCTSSLGKAVAARSLSNAALSVIVLPRRLNTHQPFAPFRPLAGTRIPCTRSQFQASETANSTCFSFAAYGDAIRDGAFEILPNKARFPRTIIPLCIWLFAASKTKKANSSGGRASAISTSGILSSNVAIEIPKL